MALHFFGQKWNRIVPREAEATLANTCGAETSPDGRHFSALSIGPDQASERVTMSPTSADSFALPAMRRSAASAFTRRPGSMLRQVRKEVRSLAATAGF